jgi:hypothetical protein
VAAATAAILALAPLAGVALPAHGAADLERGRDDVVLYILSLRTQPATVQAPAPASGAAAH